MSPTEVTLIISSIFSVFFRRKHTGYPCPVTDWPIAAPTWNPDSNTAVQHQAVELFEYE